MKKFNLLLLLLYPQLSLPAEIYIHNPPVYRPVPNNFLELQVVEGQMKLDNNNIYKAAIAYTPEGKYAGLEITLKKQAIKELELLTENAVNKKMNFVINKKIVATSIIQSALGRKFLITSMTQNDALAFLDTLDYFKFRQLK